MTYTALTIADEILRIGKKAGKSFTPMQLVKLTYIAHGWALAVLNRDLFPDRIEAWKYGPVIPSLYHATKNFGASVIPKELIDTEKQNSVDADTFAFLEDVVKKYGDLSAYSLSSLTHQTGTPWDQVFVENVKSIEIPDEIIEKHYREKLDDYKRSTAA